MGEVIRVGILTVSDRCSRLERADESGPAVQAELPTDKYIVALYAIVPDDRKIIQDTLRRWCDEYGCDVVLTTGGTGFSPRDVTPEATLRVIDRQAQQLAMYLVLSAKDAGPKAALSRAVAGIRHQTLIVNLPGSPAGALSSVRTLLPVLEHAVAVLREDPNAHKD